MKKLSRLIKSRDFYERLKFEFLVPRPRKFVKCENVLENLSFYISSLALKFLHKEICLVAIQVLSVATTRKILRFVLLEITTWRCMRSKAGSSRQMTHSNESQSKKWQMQMNL